MKGIETCNRKSIHSRKACRKTYFVSTHMQTLGTDMIFFSIFADVFLAVSSSIEPPRGVPITYVLE